MSAPGVGMAAGVKTGGLYSPARIRSMDQFRGYTMAGMFLVNFVGVFSAVHPLLKHHNTYNSYADTIMPHFFSRWGSPCGWRCSRTSATWAAPPPTAKR